MNDNNLMDSELYAYFAKHKMEQDFEDGFKLIMEKVNKYDQLKQAAREFIANILYGQIFLQFAEKEIYKGSYMRFYNNALKSLTEDSGFKKLKELADG